MIPVGRITVPGGCVMIMGLTVGLLEGVTKLLVGVNGGCTVPPVGGVTVGATVTC